LLGSLELEGIDGTTTLAAAMGFVLNQGDGWAWTLDHLERELEVMLLESAALERETETGEPFGVYLQLAATIGQRTAELHRAFATPTDDPAFMAEPIGKADLARWSENVRRELDQVRTVLGRVRDGLSEANRAAVDRLVLALPELAARIETLTKSGVTAQKTRLHGDYHLGQVLIAKGDVYVLDFEGEPARDIGERRAKTSPLKDVAGMLRSFDYAAAAIVDRLEQRDPTKLEAIRPLAQAWRVAAMRRFIQSYRAQVEGCPVLPENAAEFDRLLELFLIEKALYEIAYEAANRPSWIAIPIRGVLGLMDPEQRSGLFSDG
jgi:maltose alpha-D-glucosyltransferase/alpha-amylase